MFAFVSFSVRLHITQEFPTTNKLCLTLVPDDGDADEGAVAASDRDPMRLTMNLARGGMILESPNDTAS